MPHARRDSAGAEARRQLALADAHAAAAVEARATAARYSLADVTEKHTAQVLAPLTAVGYILDAVTDPSAPAGASPAGQAVVTGTASQVLWQVLTDAYAQLGFDVLGDEAFAAMVLARCVEPASKLATIEILGELGVRAPTRSTDVAGDPSCRRHPLTVK